MLWVMPVLCLLLLITTKYLISKTRLPTRVLLIIINHPIVSYSVITGHVPKAARLKRCCAVFLPVLMLFSLSSKAQGDLLLFPKRIVFEGSQRSQTLNLANSGKDTVRYFVSVVQVRMKKDGSFETISQPDSGQNFADRYLRFFPRSVVLAPNEAQSVKIQLVNTAELAAGEYRSHIYFRSEPDKKPLGEEKKGGDSGAQSVNLIAVFGISIPVIIRVGPSTMSMSLTEPKFEWKKDSVPSLQVAFTRQGNMSAYGDISVDYVSVQGKVKRIGVAQGLAVYTPNTERRFGILLDKSEDIDYHKGSLRIAYTTQADAKSLKMAETQLMLH